MQTGMEGGRKRARTDEQKSLRRQSILDAAESLFREGGFEAFSMAKLAKLTGVVKGTLYLYFETREEVFLVLYNQSLVRWSEVLLDGLRVGMSDREYAALFYETAMADDGYKPLLARLEQTIEHNISLQSFVSSKRIVIDRFGKLAAKTAQVLNMELPEGSEVVSTLGVLLVGASRADQAPSFDRDLIPADVLELLAEFSSRNLYTKNALRIIEGIRRESAGR
jgi:AcrR family transcriptional regulator